MPSTKERYKTMNNLTRKSFLKAIAVSTVVPHVAFGANPEGVDTIHSQTKKVSAVDSASIMRRYGIIPRKEEPGIFDFYVGKERYVYGFISYINLFGLHFPTKERHRCIIKCYGKVTTFQAVRIAGEWQYPRGSRFPHEFPIYDFAAAVDTLG